MRDRRGTGLLVADDVGCHDDFARIQVDSVSLGVGFIANKLASFGVAVKLLSQLLGHQCIDGCTKNSHVADLWFAAIKELPRSQLPCGCRGSVLYVPSAAANLLSIPRAVNMGISFNFSGRECTISKDTQLLATAIFSNELYHLGSPTAPAASASIAVDAQLWHRRFGHLSYSSMARLQRDGMVLGIQPTPADFEQAGAAVCAPCVAAFACCPLPKVMKTSSSSGCILRRSLNLQHMCCEAPESKIHGSL